MITPILVIGAGPSGLTVSAELMQRGHHVICLEREARAGGMIDSKREGGFLAECGPHSLRIPGGELPVAFKLAGIEDRLVDADANAKRRYVTRRGVPTPVPNGPLAAVGTPLLGPFAKLRMLYEPFAAKGEDRDESLADFVRRRLGKQPLAHLVDAVVGGIYAGDPEKLAVRHAFPSLYELEREHGSLIRGAFKKRGGKSRGRPRIVSFRDGMRTLTDGLGARLGDSLKLNCRITRIEKDATGYRVHFNDAEDIAREVHASRLIITTPPHRWRSLNLPEEFRSLADFGYERVPNPPVAVVTLGFKREDVAHPIDGFGVLTPGKEKRSALGIVFASSIFPGRAPEGHVTLAFFIGGMRSPDLARREHDTLIALAREEARALLGATGEPVFAHVARQEHAIPQYDRDHGELIARVEAAELTHPGIHFLGNFRGGISLPATLNNAVALAKKIAAP